MDKKDRLSYLLHQYAAGLLAGDEVAEMFELLKYDEHDEVLKDLIINERYNIPLQTNLPQHKWDAMWQTLKIQTADLQDSPVIPVKSKWSKIAAAVVLIITGT